VACEGGGKGIVIQRKGKNVFRGEGLSAITVEDPWGSWGGMAEEPESLSLSTVRDEWVVAKTELVEAGPLRGMLWVRMEGGKSSMELTCSVSRGRDAVDVSARVLWNERSARLKMVMPLAEKGETLRAEYQVPGGTVVRGPSGEVPGGRWVRAGSFGFASDGIYNFDQKDGELRATICRATRYANDVNTPADVEPWRAAVDAGELKFRFLITSGGKDLPRLAAELEQGLIALPVPPHGGEMGQEGSLAELSPESVEMLALKPAADGRGYVLRIRETANRASRPRFVLGGRVVRLGVTEPGKIQTYRVVAGKARAVSIVEEG
ncbi:MAG TPA: glycoside hydrolase family 38 C-terminal domain-containing protein, partial [Tepidisphaeraceae bacterium]|nr:glycoside hydrolase family 38 C-terminal domain-containing protein [Tepidisphaeraceae bacterium]